MGWEDSHQTPHYCNPGRQNTEQPHRSQPQLAHGGLGASVASLISLALVMSARLLRIIVVTVILILINANHSNVSKCKTMSFWQPLKMLCYLLHGLNSTSQKKTKQQNNTPTTLLVCTVTAEDTVWPQK